jgi:hypothetical protein
MLPDKGNPTPDGAEASITGWIAGMNRGEPAAAQPLWERYFAWLVELARARLRAVPRRDAGSDEEDTAIAVAQLIATKLEYIFRPVNWLFSGWNWQAVRLSRQTTAGNGSG